MIFRAARPPQLKAAIEKEFPDDFLEVEEGEWLVSAKLTAQEVSDRLAITDGTNGGAIVFKMSGFYGRAPRPIWDWISSREGKDA